MRKGHCLALLIVVLVGFCSADDAAPDSNKPGSTLTWAERLKKDLLANYDRTLRPTQHYNVTNVDVKLTIVHVDIDEENSVLSVYGWIGMNWQDLRMTWNPEEYGGEKMLILPSYYLWDAELNMHSMTQETTGNSYVTSNNVRISSDGIHRATVRASIKSFCEMNFRRWPFDTQNCSVILGRSISRNEDAVQLNTLQEELDKSAQEGSMWKVVSISSEQYHTPMENDADKISGVQYGFLVQRKVQIFQSTIIIPAIVFIVMTLVTFWLPPTATEKVLLNCLNAGMVCAFLLYFTIHLPLLATRTPLVVLFFSDSLYLTAFSLVMSVIVVNMSKSRHRKPVHPYVKNLISSPVVRYFAWAGNDVKEPISEDDEWNGELKRDSLAGESCSSSADEVTQAQLSIQRDWIQFAVVLERTCFVVYVFVYSIMAASYLK